MCTGIRFSDDKGNMYFGRNLDWSTGYGQKVVITPRCYNFNSAFLGELSAKYALIGMGIVQQEIPLYFDCGNEAGLAIAGLNFPGYAWHKENLRNYMNLHNDMPSNVEWKDASLTPFGSGSMMRGLPGDYYSTSRFVRAAYLNTHYPTQSTEEENVSRLFHTLAGVAMIDGAARMSDGMYEKTIYTGGFSSATKMYYYNTYEDPAIKSVGLEECVEGNNLWEYGK